MAYLNCQPMETVLALEANQTQHALDKDKKFSRIASFSLEVDFIP